LTSIVKISKEKERERERESEEETKIEREGNEERSSECIRLFKLIHSILILIAIMITKFELKKSQYQF
jgi:hypothetical protein